MNKWIGTGRFTRDPEIKYTQSGKAVCSFSLACSKRKGKNASDNQPTADFVNCVAWEKTAEIIGQYCCKGKQVLVVGPLQTRSYEAQDGSKRYVTEVVVRDIEFMGDKKDGGGSGHGQQPAPSGAASQFGGQAVSEEEIPF